MHLAAELKLLREAASKLLPGLRAGAGLQDRRQQRVPPAQLERALETPQLQA